MWRVIFICWMSVCFSLGESVEDGYVLSTGFGPSFPECFKGLRGKVQYSCKSIVVFSCIFFIFKKSSWNGLTVLVFEKGSQLPLCQHFGMCISRPGKQKTQTQIRDFLLQYGEVCTCISLFFHLITSDICAVNTGLGKGTSTVCVLLLLLHLTHEY